MAEVTITLRDTPEGVVTVRSTFKPAVGARATLAQSLAMDLQNMAVRRAEVIALEPERQHPGAPDGVEAVQLLSPKPGDVLVFKTRKFMTREQINFFNAYLKANIPEGVHFLAIDGSFAVEQQGPAQ
jgi:hypothetical protein